MNESKRDKFVRVAESRTNKIMNMVRLLGNCSNKNTYEYSREDIVHIFNSIEEELKMAKSRFEISANLEKSFKLDREGKK